MWNWILWGVLTLGIGTGTLMFFISGDRNEERLGYVSYGALLVAFLISTGMNLGFLN